MKTVRTNDVVCEGRFLGGELEPGSFHHCLWGMDLSGNILAEHSKKGEDVDSSSEGDKESEVNSKKGQDQD